MTDWADEIADEFVWTGLGGLSRDESLDKVAAALRAAERRGRAMGLREAAELCADTEYFPATDRWGLANYLDDEAAKLDQPD